MKTTAKPKPAFTESEHANEIRENFYRASDGLRLLSASLKKAGFEDLRENVLDAIRSLDSTEIGVYL